MKTASILVLLIVVFVGFIAGAGCTQQERSQDTGTGSGEAAVFFAQGETLGEQGNYQQALAAYQEGLQIDPDNVEALNGEGATLRALGRNDEALAAFTRATEIDPGSAPSWMNRGDALERLGRTSEADAAYRKAGELATTAPQ